MELDRHYLQYSDLLKEAWDMKLKVEQLTGKNAVITGGFPRDLAQHAPIKDVDIFILGAKPEDELLSTKLLSDLGLGEPYETTDQYGVTRTKANRTFDAVNRMSSSGTLFNLVTTEVADVFSVWDEFDFGCCMYMLHRDESAFCSVSPKPGDTRYDTLVRDELLGNQPHEFKPLVPRHMTNYILERFFYLKRKLRKYMPWEIQERIIKQFLMWKQLTGEQ